MRFLADENFPRLAVMALLQQGYDVADVAIDAPGLSDREIFAWAVRDRLILLTFDKDFGEISRTTPASAECGVILFRMKASSFLDPKMLASIITDRQDWVGHLTVVRGGSVRRRPLLMNR